MNLEFWKMNGAGNDFVVLDNRSLDRSLDRAVIARLCDRHRGVGADGLLAVEPVRDAAAADFRMRYYNADGGEAEMCGNGARCFAKFSRRLLAANGNAPVQLRFQTEAGVIGAEFPDDELVRLRMSDPSAPEIGIELDPGDGPVPVHSINTGVPHAVVWLDDEAALEALPVRRWGRALRMDTHFQPAGTNVNFACTESPGRIRIRTYERGVEAETLACGTGMVACALIHHQLTGSASPIEVRVAGGDVLTIDFNQPEPGVYRDVHLTGPADFVFHGQIQLQT